MVGKGFDPELRLSLGSSSQDWSSAESSRTDGSSANSEQNQQRHQQQQQQQITIFYNGQLCVSDVTEFQARAIISMAKQEMDDRMNKHHHQHQQHQFQQKHHNKSTPPQPPASSSQAMPEVLNQGLSMKKSLQRFLQKRKTRINALSPYNNKHGLLLFPTS
ncbi:protein TIFY 5A-like [Phoenix dactylifera]|uniref:Protein TIFY n=1 Tax=Phoenix dactylifera TaxID=42345 RepID=A0A8B9AWX7_PHODC|nr:protein TIFY 5A-like [Phoenix dactylifera]